MLKKKGGATSKKKKKKRKKRGASKGPVHTYLWQLIVIVK
jgi:hypothetical protein